MSTEVPLVIAGCARPWNGVLLHVDSHKCIHARHWILPLAVYWPGLHESGVANHDQPMVQDPTREGSRGSWKHCDCGHVMARAPGRSPYVDCAFLPPAKSPCSGLVQGMLLR